MNKDIELLSQEIDEIDVPRFHISEIEARAVTMLRGGKRRRITVSAILAALLLPALAFAAVKFVPFQVTHKYGMWQVYPPKQTSEDYRYPTQATLAKVASKARYRVVWPAGLPKSSVLEFLGADASQMFTLAYECPGTRRGYSAAIIMPKNYSIINPDLGKWFYSQTIPHGRIRKWTVGDELILLESTCLTNAQISSVQSATVAAGNARRLP